jgi:hypothetical protein
MASKSEWDELDRMITEGTNYKPKEKRKYSQNAIDVLKYKLAKMKLRPLGDWVRASKEK